MLPTGASSLVIAVSLRNLTKRFPARLDGGRRARGEVVAVDGMTLDVPSGELLGLLGPNGAGKTTTLHLLSTLLSPTEGTALIEGFDVRRHPREVRRRIGVLLAGDRAVYRRLTGRENLLYFATLYGLPEEEARTRAQALLELVELTDRADDLVERYSTGMRMRLAIARTVLHAPTVLLLDEPTVGLDPHRARLVRELISSLHRSGKTIVLATHDMMEAERLCQRVAIIDRGRIAAVGSPAELRAAAAQLVPGSGDAEPSTLEDLVIGLTRRRG